MESANRDEVPMPPPSPKRQRSPENEDAVLCEATSSQQKATIPPKKKKVDEGIDEGIVVSERISKIPIRGSGILDDDSEEVVRTEEVGPIFNIKWVLHKGRKTPIVNQNENGPCPLLAIVNSLFLLGRLKLDEDVNDITENELVQIAEMALSQALHRADAVVNPNHVQNVQDAISLLPALKYGLNVNVKFGGVKSFEYTRECLIFDSLRLPLYHGWLYDPQATDVAQAIGMQSYNQLLNKILRGKTSENAEELAEAMIAESFLEGSSSQLTIYGLQKLNTTLKEDDIGVLFRNNHFSVISKHKQILCLLVTDQGYLKEPKVVWETLTTIKGDETFLDATFRESFSEVPPVLDPAEEQQISQDVADQVHQSMTREERSAASNLNTGGESSAQVQGSQASSVEEDISKFWKCCLS